MIQYIDKVEQYLEELGFTQQMVKHTWVKTYDLYKSDCLVDLTGESMVCCQYPTGQYSKKKDDFVGKSSIAKDVTDLKDVVRTGHLPSIMNGDEYSTSKDDTPADEPKEEPVDEPKEDTPDSEPLADEPPAPEQKPDKPKKGIPDLPLTDGTKQLNELGEKPALIPADTDEPGLDEKKGPAKDEKKVPDIPVDDPVDVPKEDPPSPQPSVDKEIPGLDVPAQKPKRKARKSKDKPADKPVDKPTDKPADKTPKAPSDNVPAVRDDNVPSGMTDDELEQMIKDNKAERWLAQRGSSYKVHGNERPDAASIQRISNKHAVSTEVIKAVQTPEYAEAIVRAHHGCTYVDSVVHHDFDNYRRMLVLEMISKHPDILDCWNGDMPVILAGAVIRDSSGKEKDAQYTLMHSFFSFVQFALRDAVTKAGSSAQAKILNQDFMEPEDIKSEQFEVDLIASK